MLPERGQTHRSRDNEVHQSEERWDIGLEDGQVAGQSEEEDGRQKGMTRSGFFWWDVFGIVSGICLIVMGLSMLLIIIRLILAIWTALS